MIKGKLVEFVKRELGRDRNTLHWDDRIFEMHIALAYQELFFKSYDAIKDNLDFYCKDYDLTINTVTDNISGSNIYYAELPVNPVDLPLTNKGVISINDRFDLSYSFYPVTVDEFKHFNNTQAWNVVKKVLFYLHGCRVYFSSNLGEDVVSSGVQAKIIPSFEDIDYYDEVYIPGGSYITLVQLIAPYIANMPLYNLSNNNSNTI